MNALKLGLTTSGKPFSLPLDAVTQTFAIMAIRGAGKTVTASVMAEEMCKAGMPWMCFDPVGVWWGMRSGSDGQPNGFPVVVIGGEHGDIPLEKGAGSKIAEALASENVFAVIDVSRESKHTWRQFLTDLCLGLMEMNPESPRHLFMEEAPEFVPQRTKVALTAQCKEAVERFVRLGRNRGYGCTLISQRPATVDKDVLSQCENLLVLRTTGPHDRAALKEWIEAKATDRGLDKFLAELASLPNGTAWFWSPHWLNTFERVRIRPKTTFHPGETRTIGVAQKAVVLADVGQFVEKLRRQLTKTQVPVSKPSDEIKWVGSHGLTHNPPPEVNTLLEDENRRLRDEIARERDARRDAERRLVAVRDALRPQFDSLKTLFENLGSNGSSGRVDKSTYEPWLLKAGKAGCRRLLETLIERQELTKAQLGTLSGISYKQGTFRNYLSWLRRNGLIHTEGDMVILQQV